MNLSVKYIFILFWAMVCLPSRAQFYQYGQDPASLSWKQINTSHFQVVFPEGFEPEAQRLANALGYLYGPVSKSLHRSPKKITVFLHNHSVYSNGMVAWAPKLMDLYPTPPQDNYAMDWIDQLAVHELRHVVQMDKLNQGITHIASLLFGEQAVGAVSGLMPRWFFEGDAVNTETALTSTGRGRTASFEMEMKALVSERKELFSYEKVLRGSYRDYIPDPYHLGYPIVAWTRKNYGDTVFAKVIDHVAKKPYTLFPFALSLKKQTSLPLRKLYQATYIDLKKQWTVQNTRTEDQYPKWNSSAKRAYTNYQFPRYVNDTTIIAVKSGMDQLTEFVLLFRNGKEKRVHLPGYYNKDQFSYSSGKYCWAEQIYDPRWNNRAYSCIKTGNLETGTIKKITRKSRYFAPVLSPDGLKIAAVEVTLKNEYFLVLLNAENGNVLDRIPSQSGKFLQSPSWTKDEKNILVITTGKEGKQIESVNIYTHSWSEITKPTFRNLMYPVENTDEIIYVSDENGTDNLYSVSKDGSSKSILTNVKFGVSSPEIAPNGQTVTFTKYSSQGFDIVSANASQKRTIGNEQDLSPKLYEASVRQEDFNFQKSTVPKKEYELKKYSRLGHLINIHSWSPYYFNYNNLNLSNMVSPGVSLLSQDKLGTLYSTFGYAYTNGASYLKADLTYKGLYPVIDFSVSYGGIVPVSSVTGAPAPILTGSGVSLSGRIYLPLDFTGGVFQKGITPSLRWQYENEVYYNRYTKNYTQGNTLLTYGFNAYIYMKQSLRDLAPRWGTVLNTGYTYAPFNNNLFSDIWFVHDRLYLPGILKHHSLQLSAGYQEQLPAFYTFSSSYLSFPRGYTTASTNSITSFGSTYAFPIIYPDLALGPIIYLKRVRANLFFDFATVGNTYVGQNNKIIWRYTDLSSTGADLLFDFHFLRILFPFQAGVRMVYFPQTKQYSSQFLFNIDVSNY